MNLLKDLCAVRGASGDEYEVKKFILEYVERNKKSWKSEPEIIQGKGFQDCLILVFGKPTTAIYAHMDSIGFTVGYEKELIKIGGPRIIDGTILVGSDSKGEIECELIVLEDEEGNRKIEYVFDREIERGTNLVFRQNWVETEEYVQSCYMDNRLGVWNALKVCETLVNGAVVFSCWEEHGGGSVGYCAKYLLDKYQVHQALISDITWVTNGVVHGRGVAISMRDSGIPRKSFLNKIIGIADSNKIQYQLEVESAGGSDGTALQKSPYPIDWLFIGAPEDNVHSPTERVYKNDIDSMVELYKALMVSL